MSEKIGRNFEQAESVKPITKAEKEYTDEEITEIKEERAKTNSELLGSGARSEINEETGEEKLFASQEQIRKIHKDAKEIPAQGSSKKPAVEAEQTKKKGIKVITESAEQDEIVTHSWGGSRIILEPVSEREVFRKGKTQREKGYDIRSEKDIIEDFLWKKAESLQQARIDLEKKISILETEIANMRSRRLNLHEQDVLGKKEDEYQILTPQLNQKKQEEEEIQKKLIDLEYGMMSAEIKNEIIHAVKGDDVISKRRQKIKEEQSRIQKELNIIDGRYAAQIARKGGQQGTHLTTGRHATQIKGNIDTTKAEEEFYRKTTDTHGGKVAYGKRQRKDAGGRTIRKK